MKGNLFIMNNKYYHLFKPIHIGSLSIKNRFVMPPMLSEMDNGNHQFSDRAIAYYAERAKGGYGLIITEYMCISQDGLGCPEEMGIWSDQFNERLKMLTEAVHKEDGKIFAQLHHQGVLALQRDIKQKAAGASAISAITTMETARELTPEEIHTLVNKFADAANRAKKSGFDGVEIHAAHSYLAGQFLSPYFNKRSDEFGGSYGNRFLFCEKIIKKIKSLCGSDFPISIRMSADEYADNGLKPHDLYIYCRMAQAAGADCIHVSTGGIGGNVVTPYYMRPGFNIDKIEMVKKYVDIPVIGVGRMNDPAMMEMFLESGRLDLISMGRQSLCDPHFPNKLMDGREDEIIPCIGCLQRCFFTPGYDENDTGISCMLNPISGKEGIWKIEKAEVKKKIAIVGAGPAGLEAAWILGKRGHKVEVFERERQPGGAFCLAAIPPGKQDFGKVIHTFITLCKKYGVKMHYQTEADLNLFKNKDWNTIIIATGSKPILPPIPGLDSKKQILANNILKGKEIFSNKKTLILGGGLVGCETAEFLALYNNDISIIEMKHKAAEDSAPIPRQFLMESMKKNNIKIYTDTKIEEITEDGIKASQHNEKIELKGFEKIVIALGSVSNDILSNNLKKDSKEIYIIGDACKARDARHAIYEGALIGMKL